MNTLMPLDMGHHLRRNVFEPLGNKPVLAHLYSAPGEYRRGQTKNQYKRCNCSGA